MKIYLAVGTSLREKLTLRRVLVSYWYAAKLGFLSIVGSSKDVFLDSGAFSAKSQNARITLDEYEQFVRMVGARCSVYANLDVIGDAVGTEENQRELEGRGLSPLPVYHSGSDIGVFEKLCGEYAYVCCGGVASATKDKRMRHFERVFSVAQKQRTRVHGFGVTDIDLLKAFPWFSVDSSSWCTSATLGAGVHLFDPSTGRMHTLRKNLAQNVQYADLLAAYYNASSSDVVVGRGGTAMKMYGIAARSFELLEDWLNKRHHASEEETNNDRAAHDVRL